MEKFIKHQKKTQLKDFYLKYLTLCMAGEVGELCNEIKKMERDDDNYITQSRMNKIKLELGDVLWYYIGICRKLNIDINDIMDLNYNKLNKS